MPSTLRRPLLHARIALRGRPSALLHVRVHTDGKMAATRREGDRRVPFRFFVGGSMRSIVRLGVLALSGALLVSGCALRDPRDSYAYGRVADGLWDADYDLLIDWNFPTSSNQGPLEAPKRFRPEKAAIGVPWATGNPLAPPPDKAQAAGVEPAAATSTHDGDDDAAIAERTPDGERHRPDAGPRVAASRERAERR